MKEHLCGYDTATLFRKDAILRIRHLQAEANAIACEMNEIIREGNLPEELVELPFPEDDDPVVFTSEKG